MQHFLSLCFFPLSSSRGPVHRLSISLVCLFVVLLSTRLQSTYAQTSEADRYARILWLVNEVNVQLSAMWSGQPGELLAKSINHPVQISYSINSLCTLLKYNILKPSGSADVDLEALRAVSNIPALDSSPYKPMYAYKLRSTFFKSKVETEFIGFDYDRSYFCGGESGLPGMWQLQLKSTRPDFPINETKNRKTDKIER
jgi:hypothetical protein